MVAILFLNLYDRVYRVQYILFQLPDSVLTKLKRNLATVYTIRRMNGFCQYDFNSLPNIVI